MRTWIVRLDVTVCTREGRAFFECQQRRRREAQARLTGKPLEHRIPQPGGPAPAAATQRITPVVTPPLLPQLLVISGPDAGQEYDLSPGELIIGREDGSAIQLTDRKVSHNHALLRVRGSQVTIEDLRSTNGTRVNGTLIERQTPLAPGDRIGIGGEQLLFAQELG